MYIFVTTPEPGNPRYPREGLAAAMRATLADRAADLHALAEPIDRRRRASSTARSKRCSLDGPWHRGRVVLLGDAVHATTPHLGQGAGMAIEDWLVLADELERHDTPEAAFAAFHARRFERCRYIVEASLAICRGQLGLAPPVDNAAATARNVRVVPRNRSDRRE